VLQSNWRRPVAPDGLDRTLTARVQFTILKSGIIQDPRVVERSGNDLLDQSALRAVYDSNPLPPLPFQYGFASVTAEVVFELTPD
jgi:TonB family protein